MSDPVSDFLGLNRAAGERFEAAWARGDRPRIEDELDNVPPEARPALLKHLLRIEVAMRRARGERPRRDDYRGRFREYEALLDRLLQRRAEVPGTDGSPASPPPTADAAESSRVAATTPPVSPALAAPTPPAATETVTHAPAAREADRTLTYVAIRASGEGEAAGGRGGEALGFARGVLLQARYRLEEEIGRGGMGVVFLGHDVVLDTPVAIKAMLPPTRARSAGEQKDLERMFYDEARIGASLRQQPAIASIFDYGFHEGLPYAVFEFVPGRSLRELIRERGRLPLEEVRLLLAPMAQALDFAHARRVVHRDLKPENIRVTPEGHPKLLDLGLARVFDREERWSFAGTPAYAAPEQAAGLAVDGRADQYALGLIAFEMLTGRRPFLARDVYELLRCQREEPPPDPSSLAPGLPDDVAEALRKVLGKEPSSRFESCTSLARALGCRFLSDAAEAPTILREAECRPDPRHTSREVDRAYLILTPGALWVNVGGEVTEWPLESVAESALRGRRTLRLRVGVPDGSPVGLEFSFRGKGEAAEWRAAIDEAREAHAGDSRRKAGPGRSAPVVLLERVPTTRHQVLGPVTVEASKRRQAEGLLVCRGALADADAVVDLRRERRLRFDRTTYTLSGVAIRALDAEGRIDLRSRWYEEEAARIGVRMSLIWFVYLAILGIGTVPSLLRLTITRGEAPRAAILVGPIYAGIVLGWLFLMTLAMRRLKWPQLAHPAAVTLAGYGWAQIVPVAGMLVGLFARGSVAFGLPMALVLGLSMLLFLGFMRFHFSLARRTWHACDLFRAEFGDRPPPASPGRERAGRWAAVVAGMLALLMAAAGTFGGFGLVYSLTFNVPDPR